MTPIKEIKGKIRKANYIAEQSKLVIFVKVGEAKELTLTKNHDGALTDRRNALLVCVSIQYP